jgi:hypothetical protein
MNTMPVAYLDIIQLEFSDGRVWEIDIREELNKQDANSIADTLINTLQEFKDDIKKIDFKIDIERLKKDISSETNKLF